MQLTKQEMNAVATSPLGLQAVVDYLDTQIAQADAMGHSVTVMETRRDSVEKERERLAAEWGL